MVGLEQCARVITKDFVNCLTQRVSVRGLSLGSVEKPTYEVVFLSHSLI